MKKIIFYTLLLLSISVCVKANRIDIIPDATGNTIYHAKGNEDTLVLNGAYTWKSWCTFFGLKNVVIINANGQANLHKIDLVDCINVKIEGNGDASNLYGIKLSQSTPDAPGISISGHSRKISVEHVEFFNSYYGIWCKNDGNCQDTTLQSWVIDSCNFNFNYFHNMRLEAMYIGTTDPNAVRTTICTDGRIVHLKPSFTGAFQIIGNIIDSAGRTAIQLSDGKYGRSEIAYNIITNVGYENLATNSNAQSNGIILGGYTIANVHDNYVSETYSEGIVSYGMGIINIYHNTVFLSGYLDGHTSQSNSNILIDCRPTYPLKKQTFKIRNNRVEKITINNTLVPDAKLLPIIGYTLYNVIVNNGAAVVNNYFNIPFRNTNKSLDTTTGARKLKIRPPVKDTTVQPPVDTTTTIPVDTTITDTTTVPVTDTIPVKDTVTLPPSIVAKATGTMFRQYFFSNTAPGVQALLWLPDNFDTSKSYPLLIAIPGVGEISSDIHALIYDSRGNEKRTMAARIADGYSPQLIVLNVLGSWYNSPQIKQMYDWCVKNMNINLRRVYLTGLSAGGYSAYSALCDSNVCKLFAAIAPIDAAGDDNQFYLNDKFSNVAKYHLPVLTVCGQSSQFFNLTNKYFDKINSYNPNPQAAREFVPGEHVGWIYAYNPQWLYYGKNLCDWFLQFEK